MNEFLGHKFIIARCMHRAHELAVSPDDNPERVAGTGETNSSESTRKSMRANTAKDTKPELFVRRLVHRMGFRYRLHQKNLPGKPDLVFGPRRKVIFVHGCFWHQHDAPLCRGARIPKIREGYWGPKLQRNKDRDKFSECELERLGWQSLILWECQLKNHSAVGEIINRFLVHSD